MNEVQEAYKKSLTAQRNADKFTKKLDTLNKLINKEKVTENQKTTLYSSVTKQIFRQNDRQVKFMLNKSHFIFIMPKVMLIIPTNLENENSLSLKLAANFSQNRYSLEQRRIEYIVKINEETGLNEDFELKNEILDYKATSKISLQSLRLYVHEHNGPDFDRKSTKKEMTEQLGLRSKGNRQRDYIINGVDLVIENETTSFANHDYKLINSHSVTMPATF